MDLERAEESLLVVSTGQLSVCCCHCQTEDEQPVRRFRRIGKCLPDKILSSSYVSARFHCNALKNLNRRSNVEKFVEEQIYQKINNYFSVSMPKCPSGTTKYKNKSNGIYKPVPIGMPLGIVYN